jgi:hypothetical protein
MGPDNSSILHVDIQTLEATDIVTQNEFQRERQVRYETWQRDSNWRDLLLISLLA